MLQGMTWASPPSLRMPSATSSQASALRLEITTLAPSCASSSAEARPMPRLEPVITATWPARSKGVFFIGCFLRQPPLRSDEAIQTSTTERLLDCFAALAMTSTALVLLSFRDGPKDQTRNDVTDQIKLPASATRRW